MLNKKSIELSLNFIVIIILSIIIFGFGVKFISTLFSQANEFRDITFDQLDERIGDIICEGSERVCIGADKKTIGKGKFDVFGVKMLNIINDENFEIKVSPSNPIGYKKNNEPISRPLLNINPKNRALTIKKNTEKIVGIGVEVPTNAVSGIYIMNVDITITSSAQKYVQTQKLYVNVP